MKHHLRCCLYAIGWFTTLMSCTFGFFSVEVHAGSLSGQLQILKKGGRKPLDSGAYAVAYLTGVNSVIATPPSDKPVFINQRDKRFSPRVLPLVKGQLVHFYNRDELEHNVFSTAEKNSFDLGRYAKDDFRPVNYNQAGGYKVYCNIHQKMILDIMVLNNHYFALTDDDGKYAINNIPDGDYQLNFWHIYGGKTTLPVKITAAPLVLESISLTSTKVVRNVDKHKNKYGKKYKNKGRYRR
jgi:plastocyanin